MKIAVSSSGKDLDSNVDPRFGRCAYFIIYDTEDMTFDVFDNGSISLGGGAGIQSAQFVASKGAKAVITGNCGPNAVKTLAAAGLQLFVGQSGTVKECIERFKKNELRPSQEANVPDHFGMTGEDTPSQQQFESTGSDKFPGGGGMGMGGGGGMGRGMGMGGGRGMGRGMGMGGGRGMGRGMGMGGGRGMGRGMITPAENEYNQREQEDLPKEQELSLLKDKAKDLTRQMENIQSRIKKLEKND